ncbi:precorrin-3B C(17)-methyltransferase [Salininema proteolyticum]|uniref:Precorrin-3B C(17)-methyltransferase n=1 Tax=Salininema proteolyticum TaxID=1607685 RepID=A0ABV8U5S1_9ACTN
MSTHTHDHRTADAPNRSGRDPHRVTVIAATAAGRALGARLAESLGGAFAEGRPSEALAEHWPSSGRIVMVMAAGAAVRLLAPHLGSKQDDPGVVCVDDTGRHAIALVGGHEGGANQLAGRVARFLAVEPVITTASENAGLPNLGELGGELGLKAEGDIAALGGHLVSGGSVRLERETAWPTGALPYDLTDDADAPALVVSDRVRDASSPAVFLRPPSLHLGIGSSRGVSAEEVGKLIDETLAEAGLSPASVAGVASIDVKADEEGITQAAVQRGWEVVYHSAEELNEADVPNPSAVVAQTVGTPSVSEAAALLHGDELVVPKRRSAMATVAVSRRAPRGRLALISLGPGADDLTTPRAQHELGLAEVVLGYGAYLDAAAPWIGRGTAVERFALGEEEKRARRALELAREGRAVAMVGSGDVGVYAMGSPTLEITGDDIDVVSVPGVTASLAASSILGAPFGHDHCHISLSDLLTPWEVIERRLHAAAAGDFAVAFYNPRSRGRDWQLSKAREILLTERSADTPVGIVKDAERPNQEVLLTTLGELDVEQVHMTTVVLVGNSRTRYIAGRMVTPRGYRDRHED